MLPLAVRRSTGMTQEVPLVRFPLGIKCEEGCMFMADGFLLAALRPDREGSMALKQDTGSEAEVDSFLLKLPVEEGQTAQLSRFLDALIQATRNTIKVENKALRRFRPSGRVVTTFKPEPQSRSGDPTPKPCPDDSYEGSDDSDEAQGSRGSETADG